MSAVTDLAELVVSELVTNALRHGIPAARKPGEQQCVRLRLLAQAPFVMCMVTDLERAIPVIRDSGPRRRVWPWPDRGRGLLRALGLAPARRGRQGRLGIVAVTAQSLGI